MCGVEHGAPLTRKKLKAGEFLLAEHVRRDMQHLLESLSWHVEQGGQFLLSDERPMLMLIAEDYGLDWPSNL